jgi:hypothetical protein
VESRAPMAGVSIELSRLTYHERALEMATIWQPGVSRVKTPSVPMAIRHG